MPSTIERVAERAPLMLSVGMIESLQSVGVDSVVVGWAAMIKKLLSKFDLNTKK